MNKDFQDFSSDKNLKTDNEIDQNILNVVEKDLNPEHRIVFLKLLSVQAFIGFLTLVFCPQFDFSLTNNYDLFHWFHINFGEQVCMLICGTIFVGTGSIFASNILSYEEVHKIRKTKFLYFLSLTIIFLTTFLAFGAKIYLELTSFWFIGAILSGVFLFEVSSFLRLRLRTFL